MFVALGALFGSIAAGVLPRRRDLTPEAPSEDASPSLEGRDVPVLVAEDIVCECDDSGVLSVTGTVANRGEGSLRHAQVEVNFYDDDGAQVGGAMALINNLAPAATWRFKALAPGAAATRFKIVRVSGS